MEAASLAHTSWIAPFLCLTPFFLRMVRISAASRPPAWVTTSPSLTKPALSITAQTTSFPPQVISGLLKRGCALAWRTLSTLASSRGLNPAHAVMISSARESVTPALTEERLRQSAQRPKGGPRCRSCMRKCFHMKLLLSGVMIFLTSLTLGACFLQSKLTSLRPPLSSGWIMTSWATWFIFDPHRKLPMTSLMFFSRCGDRGQTASTWFTKESTNLPRLAGPRRQHARRTHRRGGPVCTELLRLPGPWVQGHKKCPLPSVFSPFPTVLVLFLFLNLNLRRSACGPGGRTQACSPSLSPCQRAGMR
ncbi:uncharacterized protein LOC114449601 isoform X2 [Parambassis ranga]|uniref:Uncharacterized protein LOC114449601 isoform X2 n=1 Tax=Parambassis ranga TaxID=210632 RepID=A0A6P7K369_9TELE|nr:uncharacterized protein LOC114449601 isoform X2 [Parambassis ranga]